MTAVSARILVQKQCIECKEVVTILVDAERYAKWLENAGNIQGILTELSEDEREPLISGVCGACFDSLFEEENEREFWEAGRDPNY